MGGVLSVGRMGCDQKVLYYTLDQLVYGVLAMYAVLPPIFLVPTPNRVWLMSFHVRVWISPQCAQYGNPEASASWCVDIAPMCQIWKP